MSVEEFYDFLHDQYYVWKYDAPNRLSVVRGYLRKQKENGALSQQFCKWHLPSRKFLGSKIDEKFQKRETFEEDNFKSYIVLTVFSFKRKAKGIGI